MSATGGNPTSPLGRPPAEPAAGLSKIPATIAGLGERVCRYFLEFLETDFKRQQAPRRKLTGQYVRAIEPQPFKDASAAALERARLGCGTATNAVERYVDSVIDALSESLEKKVIAPLLAMLESTVKQQAYSALDSVYELETDLVNALVAQAASALPEALNTYLVTGDLAPAESVLEDLLEPEEAKQRLQDCLHDFATADLYQELRDLFDYQRTQETAQLYLYLCDLQFGHHTYPLRADRLDAGRSA